MAITHTRSRRKPSGGRYIGSRHKRKYEMANQPTLTGLGNAKSISKRIIGGNIKFRLLQANIANVYDPKTKKYSKAAIKTIVENPANRHYVRRNIMTKGTIIETDKGKARIVNRPGQEKVVNAILL